MSEAVKTTEKLRPGERAPRSGVYAIYDSNDRTTGETRPVSAGTPFPPTRERGNYYRLEREVQTQYTTTASGAVFDETSATYAVAIKRLAEK